MFSRELRKRFLHFFKEKDHTIVSSSPVIPHNDPTLLFVNAGMNQFKDVFLGKTNLEYRKAASSQKCVRVGGKHNDLDNVGHTTRHLTLFEMLGNFSFGDYFKKEAIEMAWNFSTHVMQLPVEKLWVSIYVDDDEAFELWKSHIDEKRIVRISGKDNFWEMGDVGPCGPCTELFYDKGDLFGKGRNPIEDAEGERFFEFWNLVFMQYNQEESGKKSLLPKPCVDTGMGLERMISLLQGADNVFQTDVLFRLIKETESISKEKYDSNKAAFNVIADHMRALSFSIADGAVPSNVDRGYVLRKVLRRAVRYGRKLSLNKPFLAKLLPALIEEMGEDFPELASSKEKIEEIITIEEENFLRTLTRGGNILNTIIEKSNDSKRREISGDDAFKLKDTYGFPLEEILLLAKDSGLQVNLEGYQILEEKARELSKQSRKEHAQVVEESVFSDFATKHPATVFLGYDQLEVKGTIIGLLKDGEFVHQIKAGDEASIILDQTSFYAEMGGQTGDSGTINHHSAHFSVVDCKNPYPGVVLHTGKLKTGILMVGEPVQTSVEEERRTLICRNHTGTHLLHWALEKVLGPHIRQAGSSVGPNSIRFDFSHHKALTREQIREVELLIAEAIRINHPVEISEISYEQVKTRSDIKQFFGDKYGSTVRVVDIDNFAKELCGGTHVDSLSQIGHFRIVKESSIAAGVRRIEAVSGKLAEEYSYTREDFLNLVCDKLDTQPLQVETKIDALFDEIGQLRHQLKSMRKVHIKSVLDDLMTKKEVIGNINVVCATVELMKDEFAPLANDLFSRLGSCLLILGMKEDDRARLLVKVSPDLIAKNLSASEIIKAISPEISGSGGGKPDNAQAGGTNPEGLEKAYKKAKSLIKK